MLNVLRLIVSQCARPAQSHLPSTRFFRLKSWRLQCVGHHVSPATCVCSGLDIRVGGTVAIGDRTWLGQDATIGGLAHIIIGSRAAVFGGVTIVEGSIVGAGAVVTKDLPGDCLAVDVPARQIPRGFKE